MIKNTSIPSVSAMDAEHLPRHRWYFFKEAFSPAIVDFAIEKECLGKNSIVFDPFSGSGTTPLSAGLAGVRGLGTEVNPFMRFVSETKTLSSTRKAFDSTVERAINGATKGAASPLLEFSTFSEFAPKSKSRGKWLFNSPVLRAFEGGWQEIKASEKPEVSLAKLCLIGAAMDVSNAAKDGKCLRYKTDWKNLAYDAQNFIAAFQSRAATIREDIENYADNSINAEIRLGDSRAVGATEKFDLCVTSPPYLNSFDYTDVYRPELFLGGFVTDMAQLRELRLSTLRSHVQTAWEDPVRNDFGSSYVEAMSELRNVEETLRVDERRLWNKKLPLMIQAYFEDMERVLVGLRKKAKPLSSIWLVVSTSAYAGVEFPVDLIIADIAGRCGWLLREVVVLRHLKRVAGQQWEELSQREGATGPHLRESLVVLDINPRQR